LRVPSNIDVINQSINSNFRRLGRHQKHTKPTGKPQEGIRFWSFKIKRRAMGNGQ